MYLFASYRPQSSYKKAFTHSTFISLQTDILINNCTNVIAVIATIHDNQDLQGNSCDYHNYFIKIVVIITVSI